MVSSVGGSSSSTFNTNGISVGANGKIQVSGFSSGIDWQSLIQAQLTADSVPITTLQTKITANNTLVSAYNDLKTKVASFQNALDALRNNTTPGATTTNVFTQMTGSGSTAASDTAPVGYTPSDINSLLTTSFTSKAQTAEHSITIEQVAKAQQIASDVQAVTSSTDLAQTGTLTINGKNVAVTATDSLVDIRDKINSAGAGVNATIISADSTHNYLVLTATKTGDAASGNAITLTQTALSDTLGLTDGSAAAKNELQAGQNAIVDVDGITGISRATNVIGDVIDGVTLSLTKAEPDTVIDLQIQPDLNSIKSAIGTFISTYNDLKNFITGQQTITSSTDSAGNTTQTVPPLFSNATLRQVGNQLSFMVSAQMFDNDDGYQSLSQIGISQDDSTFNLKLDDSSFDPKLLADVTQVKQLFGFNATTSDSRFSVLDRGANTAAGTYYLSLDGTDGSGQATGGRIADASGTGTSSDGSLNLLGNNVLKASDTSAASGLTVAFANTTASLGPIADVTVTVSRGIADSFFDFFKGLTASQTGTLDTLVSQVQTQNTDYQSQITTLNTRLDQEQVNLTAKYTHMETALAQLTQLQNTITNFFKSDSSSSS
jgi:flagellar hook-associated protein 2